MLNLVGILLPPLVDLINRKIKDSDIRFWISVGVGVLVGTALNLYQNNGFTGVDSVVSSIMAVFGWMQLSYKGIYENSRAQEVIRKL